MDDCMNNLQFNESDNLILVGHSLFFRKLFRRYPLLLPREKLTSEETLDKASLYENLKRYKLANCACVAVEFTFRVRWPSQLRRSISVDTIPRHLNNATNIPTITSDFEFKESPRDIVQNDTLKSDDKFLDNNYQSFISDVEMMFGSTLNISDEDSSMSSYGRDILRESR
mmetsp:Transcript_16570/g.18739  ORF Transcript_16570/g.18739 Transcript_16570/m.18739 type:complete len:170 (-) Transcript_16570:879-1388(-)